MEKYIQQRIGKLPSVAWLLKIETGSILIKEKPKHLSKMLDRVSKLMKRERLKFGLRESSHRSIYQHTKFICYRIVLLCWVSWCRILGWRRGRKKDTFSNSYQRSIYFLVYWHPNMINPPYAFAKEWDESSFFRSEGSRRGRNLFAAGDQGPIL